MEFSKNIGLYIINLNENSKETADGYIYIILENFENLGSQMGIYIFIYIMAIPLCRVGGLLLGTGLITIIESGLELAPMPRPINSGAYYHI